MLESFAEGAKISRSDLKIPGANTLAKPTQVGVLRGSWMGLSAWIRGSWMGLSAWTIVYARGHKKRSCTQSHSWTPFIHQFMMDHPSYAIICRFIPLIFQKYTKTHHLYCHFPHLKVPVKSATCLECTIQNRGVRCACTYAWAHNNKFLRRTSNFSAKHFLKYYSSPLK